MKRNGTHFRCHWVIPEPASRYRPTPIRYFNYRNGIWIWQLFGSLAVANIHVGRRTCDIHCRAYKPRTRSTLLITRCIMAKFRYFKKAKFYYFKQVVNLSATCFHVELEQFWHAFASRGFVSDSWAFLFFSSTRPVMQIVRCVIGNHVGHVRNGGLTLRFAWAITDLKIRS